MSQLPSNLSFWDHLEELRRTVIRCLLVVGGGSLLSLCVFPTLFQWITYPLQTMGEGSRSLVILGPAEGLSTAIRLSFWSSLALTSPLWLFLLLRFAHPALKGRERQLIPAFFICSLLFFFLGIAVAFYGTLPLANQVLFHFNAQMGENLWSMSHYLNYTLILVVGNGLAFECTVVLFFLVHEGYVKAQLLSLYRRQAAVAIFVLSALLTPPDILTQLLLALPLLLLYECAIGYGRLRHATHQRKKECREVPEGM